MKKASKIKQALMQDLLTGKIRVKVEGIEMSEYTFVEKPF